MEVTQSVVDLLESLQRCSEKTGLQEQKLSEHEQGVFVGINHMFPRDSMFRDFLCQVVSLYSICAVDNTKMVKFVAYWEIFSDLFKEI